MRNLAITYNARRNRFTSEKGRRILGPNEINMTRSFHLRESNEKNRYENPETGGHDNRLGENPWLYENLGSSESFEVPDISNVEIDDDISSENNHPICVDCVTPMHQGVEGHTNEDDVIINLEVRNLDQGLMEDFDLSGHDTINLTEDPRMVLSKLRANNPNRPILGHLNVNFLASKLESLKDLIKDKLDILVVTETKIDESYPTSQFSIDGFSTPFRLDRNKSGGGVMIYVKEHLLCVEIPFQNKPKDIECILLDLRIRNKRFLLVGGDFLT